LESKWPSSSTSAFQRWMKLRHTVLAVAQFKRGMRRAALRRASVYSNSESDYDQQSVDSSYLDPGSVAEATVGPVGRVSTTILRDTMKVVQQRGDTINKTADLSSGLGSSFDGIIRSTEVEIGSAVEHIDGKTGARCLLMFC